MQLHLVLAQVEPAALALPSRCPSPHCGGTDFRLHQQVVKRLKDALHQTVLVRRYRCCRCGHTFRVYPMGVTHAHTSRSVQQIAVLLYLLGLSYDAVSSALEALGVYLSKSRVHDAVRVARIDRGCRSETSVFDAILRRRQSTALHVRWKDHWLPLSLSTDRPSALVLTLDRLAAAEVALLHERLTPLVAALGGHVVGVDHDGAAGRTPLPGPQ